jgi:hypothetical protein
VEAVNYSLNKTTSPALINVPATRTVPITGWFHWLTVVVKDQFGHALTDLYTGVEVQELLPAGTPKRINQQLSSAGTYQDPVGVYRIGHNQEMRAGAPIVQDFGVKVGGHRIGTVKRTVIYTPPKYVEIVWPE